MEVTEVDRLDQPAEPVLPVAVPQIPELESGRRHRVLEEVVSNQRHDPLGSPTRIRHRIEAPNPLGRR